MEAVLPRPRHWLWHFFAELISRPFEKSKDDRTAERLMKTYGDSIYRLAYSYVHNEADAEEILEDTILRHLEKAPEFENENHEKAWILRVAGNLSKDRIRYNKYRETDELEDNLAAEKREDLSFVWDAVKDLPVKYREVIHLYYYEGYSTDEIAEILHRRSATIRTELRRARMQLKSVLKEAYDFDE